MSNPSGSDLSVSFQCFSVFYVMGAQTHELAQITVHRPYAYERVKPQSDCPGWPDSRAEHQARRVGRIYTDERRDEPGPAATEVYPVMPS